MGVAPVPGPPPPPPPASELYSWTPVWARGPPPPPSQADSLPGIQKVASGISIYRVVLLLNLVIVPVALGLGFGTEGAFLALGSSASVASLDTAASVVFTAVVSVVGFVGLILLIFAFVRWWEGVTILRDRAGAFGGPHAADVAVARTSCLATLIVYIVQAVVVSIVVAAALFAAELGTISTVGSEGNATAAPSLSPVLTSVLFVTVPVATAFALLLYFLAGRSLALSIAGTVSRLQEARLRQARVWLLVGAATTVVSLAVVWSPILLVLEGIPTLILIVGMTRFLAVYREWSPTPSPPPSSGRASG